jgi:sugar phosphate isomerase/epimerase
MAEDYFSGRGDYFGSKGSDYFGDIDSFSSHPQYAVDSPAQPSSADTSEGLNFTAKNIGSTTDPFGNTLESLKSRIREGSGRVEFNFLQTGKGNARSPTPEMYGSKERRDMRELVKANDMKTSVHAPVTEQSLAGFDPQSGGFDDQRRGQVQREIKRAIDFASEAGTGGAVVFHMHEWNRPVEELNDRDDDVNWREYPGPVGEQEGKEMDEQEVGAKYVVDSRNGSPIRESVIRKDQTVYRPQYETAATDDEVSPGDEVPVEGRPGETHVLDEDDWVSLDGKYVPENADTDTLFKRVPRFNDDQEVEVDELDWTDIKRRTREYNDKFNEDMQPEEYYAQVELENRAMQARGQSLRANRRYQQNKRQYKRFKDVLNKYQDLKDELPDDEEWKAQQYLDQQLGADRIPEDNPEEFLQNELKSLENELKYAHDASSSADVQAKEIKQKIENLSTVQEYGQDKTASTIANAADYAMKMYEKRKDKYDLEDPIYVAPENWNHQFYGSHPDEYKEIIDSARNEFEERLQQRGMDEATAKDKAQTHIQGTLDIGHMNTFRDRFERKDGEELAEYEERFNNWLLDETKDLVEQGYVGHIHLNDNFGYEDEHVTPGEGNAPMRQFLQNLEEEGMDDIIVEQGSFNEEAHLETLNLANSPVYGMERSQRFQQTRRGHWGYRSPAMFMAGSYSPSNDFQLWTQTPLE